MLTKYVQIAKLIMKIHAQAVRRTPAILHYPRSAKWAAKEVALLYSSCLLSRVSAQFSRCRNTSRVQMSSQLLNLPLGLYWAKAEIAMARQGCVCLGFAVLTYSCSIKKYSPEQISVSGRTRAFRCANSSNPICYLWASEALRARGGCRM